MSAAANSPSSAEEAHAARTKRVNSPSSAEVRKPLYRTAVGRWRNYEKYLEPYMSGLEPFLKELNYH